MGEALLAKRMEPRKDGAKIDRKEFKKALGCYD
jgi:hypothetical protein